MATLQGIGVIRSNVITRKEVNNPAKIRIAIVPGSIAGFAIIPEEMITKMGTIPSTFPNGDQFSAVTLYMVKDLFSRSVRDGVHFVISTQ